MLLLNLLVKALRLLTLITLSPYTTLFRSHGELRARRCVHGVGLHRADRVPDPDDVARHQFDRHRALTDAEPRRQEDRKSTRLNSSHVSISYAVFCLKKKNA